MSPDIATALRTETPAAPSELRDRIALIAAATPPPRRTLSLRRFVLIAAPTMAAASLAVAVAVGVKTAAVSDPQPEASRSAPASATAGLARRDRVVREGQAVQNLARALRAGKVPGPSTERAQDVQADLRVLVDDPDGLSTATQRALRTTRRLGGYVVTVQYGTPEPSEGTADLRVRIPVSRVQTAIVQFSDLGRILAQQTRISDLQQPLDDLTRRIRRLERRAAGLKGAELARVKAQIAALRRERVEINRRAAFATVDLSLTTHEPEKKAPAPGRLDRAIDDATGILAAELAIVAYALIVVSPFLILLALAFAGSRAYRRYADQRLLERA